MIDLNYKRTFLERWGVTAEQVTTVIDGNPSLGGMVVGYLAEYKLEDMWFTGREHVEGCTKQNDHNRKKKGDLAVLYKGWKFTVESKSLQTNSIRKVDGVWTGRAQCDGSDSRMVTFEDGSTLKTACLLTGGFDILAVNLFAFTGEWKFIFCKNIDLPRSSSKKYTEAQRSKLLASLVPVSWPPEPPFRDEPFSLFDELIEARRLK